MSKGGDFLFFAGGFFALGALIGVARNKKGATMGGNSKSIAMYRLPDGSLKAGRANAILTTPAVIVSLAAPYWGNRSPGFFAGVADRETTFAINEEDTDFNDDGLTVKRKTYGPFQSDVITDSVTTEGQLGPGVKRFVVDMIKNLEALAKAAGFDSANPPRDAYAYLAWSHNAGLGGVPGKFGPLDSIKAYGMDWEKLKTRDQNDYMRKRMIPYGDAVLRYVDMYPTAGNV
jgi:hypothetical protein